MSRKIHSFSLAALALLMLTAMVLSQYFCVFNTIKDRKNSINCPDGWKNKWNQCFGPKFYQVTQDDAIEECRKENSSLASIHNADENALVLSLLESKKGWISGLRPFETWVWLDGTAWDWETFEEGGEEGEDCLKMTNIGGWVPADCNETLSAFICRADVAKTVQPIENVNATGGLIPHSPESWALYAFIFLPGIILSLISLFHIFKRICCSSSSPRISCACPFPWKILKCFILAIIPIGIFGIVVNILTNVKKDKCEMCRLSAFFSCCCCEAFTLCPFHGDLLWFIGSIPNQPLTEAVGEDSELEKKEKEEKERRKKMMMDLYCSSTSLFYGAVLSFCLHSYILLQTPSGDVPFPTKMSIMLGIFPLVKTPYNLLFVKNDDKEKKQFLSRLKTFVSVHLCCCCRQEEGEEEEERRNICQIMKDSVKGDICSISYFIGNVILSLTKFWLCKCCWSCCQKEEGENGLMKRIKIFVKENWMKWLKICVSCLLMFTNSMFNIGTMVVIFSYSKRVQVGNLRLFLGLSFGYTILFVVIVSSTGVKCKRCPWSFQATVSRLAMAWGNMFVFTVPLRQKSKQNFEAAVKVQLVHYFVNIIALPYCVQNRPDDYIFVPDWIIWPYFVFGWFSLLVLFAWLIKPALALEMEDVVEDSEARPQPRPRAQTPGAPTLLNMRKMDSSRIHDE